MPKGGRPIEHVIFDWGGVFSRRPPGASARSLERRLGLERGTLGGFFKEEAWVEVSTGRIAEDEFWKRVCAQFPNPPDDALSQRIWRHFFHHGLVRKGVIAIAQELRSSGTGVSLLNNAGPSLRPLLAPLLHLFDDVVISAEVGIRKPEAEIYALALERLHLPGESVLFIDDFTHNVAAAREAGLQAHRFLGPARLRRVLQRHGLLISKGVAA